MIYSKWAGKIYFMFSHIWYMIYLFCRWWFHAGQREHNTGRPSQLSIPISSSSAHSSSSLFEWAGSRMEDQDEGSGPVIRIRIHHNGNRITDRDERCAPGSWDAFPPQEIQILSPRIFWKIQNLSKAALENYDPSHHPRFAITNFILSKTFAMSKFGMNLRA